MPAIDRAQQPQFCLGETIQDVNQRRAYQGKILIMGERPAGVADNHARWAGPAVSIGSLRKGAQFQAESIAMHQAGFPQRAHIFCQKIGRSQHRIALFQRAAVATHILRVKPRPYRVAKIRRIDPLKGLRIENQVVGIRQHQAATSMKAVDDLLDIGVAGHTVQHHHPRTTGQLEQARVGEMRQHSLCPGQTELRKG